MTDAPTHRPWTAAEVAAAGRTPDQIQMAGDRLYWTESRPDEGGRVSLMQAWPGAPPIDILPAPFSARSRLLEYGGGAFAIGGGALWFVNDPGQDLYRLDLADGAMPQRIWTGGPDRFGDLYWDAAHGRLLAVREAADGRLSLVALDAGGLSELAAGADFYANPRVSADGRALLFIAWDAPHMPWDAAALYRATLVDGRVRDAQRIAGGPDRSVCQAEFDARGDIVLLGETDGWWTPLRWHDGALHRLWSEPVDCGFPRWQGGMRQLALLDDGRIVWVATRQGRRQLMVFEPSATTVVALDLPWTEYAGLTASGRQLACIAAAPDRRWEVMALRLDPVRTRVCSDAPPLPAGVWVASPRWLAFQSGESEAYGHFYAPPPRGGDTGTALPPLLVRGHGGPTSRATTALEPRTQFWTSRGFAVLDVDYRGSTGYGQAYRQALEGRWGEADVADCVAGADYLVATGAVDGARCVISGSSAGGLTVLGALAFHERFAAGGCYYGIGDLAALAQDTHKFEAHYLDRLVGPWPAAEAIYRARSPRFHARRIRAPVIFFQGAEDRVVPPAQCREMARLLRENGVAAEYHEFAGEGHGFRRAETVIACLEAEAAFYDRLFR